ncbi:cytochrome bd-I oxidase subunit CydX [Psychromonas ossibalaenae]|nr:cytochrome bd-I oxidase subunit CydX [Psychromonas ossibalaenae]
MWYFAWILGILLACSFGIINGLWYEQIEANEKEAQQEENGEN